MHGIVILIDRQAERGIIRDDSGMFYDFQRQDMVFWMDFQMLGTGTAVTFKPQRRKRVAMNVELRLPEGHSQT
jgi:hypothetical protein